MPKPNLSKGKFLLVAMVLVFVLGSALAGCSKEPREETTETGKRKEAETQESSIPTDRNFEIKIMSWHEPEGKYSQAYNTAIKEYMKLHPNVTIEHLYQPLSGDGYDKLLDTQFVARKAPDAMLLFLPMIEKYTNSDYLMLLDGYMHEKSAYSGAPAWVNSFINGEASFTGLKSQNKYGAIAFVPVDGGPGQNPIMPFFYNKRIFQEAGITELPETWEQFMEACKKIKEAGYDPVAADNGRFFGWIVSWIGSQFGDGYMQNMFDEKFKKPGLWDEMATTAVLTGKIDKADPVVNAQFDIIKDWSRYWQVGWAGMPPELAQQGFLYGQTAMLLDGNWMYGFYEDNIKDFEFGILQFPLITKETSPYANEGFPQSNSEQGYGWGLNKDLEKDPNKLRVVIDFFQYLTSVEVQSKMAEIGVFAPVTAGVKAPEKLAPFLASDKNKVVYYLDNPLMWESSNAFPNFHAWLTDQFDKETFLNKLEEDNKKFVTQKAKDMLDAQIGLPQQIKALEKSLKAQQEQGQPAQIIETTQKSLDLALLKLEFFKRYAEPVLK